MLMAKKITTTGSLISAERIEKMILRIRQQNVMLDSDLAELYGVSTGNLNRAVSRNRDRFPDDFSFRLTKEEYDALRFQFGISKRGEHSKYLPQVFTEQGVAMLSSVLRSLRAARGSRTSEMHQSLQSRMERRQIIGDLLHKLRSIHTIHIIRSHLVDGLDQKRPPSACRRA